MLFRRKPPEAPTGLARRSPRQRPLPTAQSQAFSYYAARSQAEVNTGREAAQHKMPARRLPSRLQRLRSHAGWLAGGLILAGLIVFELQISTVPRIVTLSASSDTPFLQDVSVYQQAAHKLFDASAVNRNKLTADTAAIAKHLETAFPELQEVSVSMPLFGSQPVVYIKPAEPALVLAANNGNFIVDQNGRALAAVTAGTTTGRLHIPSVTDQSPLAVRLGDQVLPSTVTSFIGAIQEQYKAKRVGVSSMVLPASAGELDVYVAGQPYYVKFNIQALGNHNGLQQIGSSLAVMKQLSGKGTVPSQYIDVRSQGRAYYL